MVVAQNLFPFARRRQRGQFFVSRRRQPAAVRQSFHAQSLPEREIAMLASGCETRRTSPARASHAATALLAARPLPSKRKPRSSRAATIRCASSSRNPFTSRIPSRIACLPCASRSSVQSTLAHSDVHRQDLHVLPLRLLQQLRRLIEPHRLTVDEAGEKRRGAMTFQPARNIREQRERRRMRFRKAVLAEAFDLLVDLFGERFRVAVRAHALHELLAGKCSILPLRCQAPIARRN